MYGEIPIIVDGDLTTPIGFITLPKKTLEVMAIIAGATGRGFDLHCTIKMTPDGPRIMSLEIANKATGKG
jgi:hypothetical protein